MLHNMKNGTGKEQSICPIGVPLYGDPTGNECNRQPMTPTVTEKGTTVEILDFLTSTPRSQPSMCLMFLFAIAR